MATFEKVSFSKRNSPPSCKPSESTCVSEIVQLREQVLGFFVFTWTFFFVCVPERKQTCKNYNVF